MNTYLGLSMQTYLDRQDHNFKGAYDGANNITAYYHLLDSADRNGNLIPALDAFTLKFFLLFNNYLAVKGDLFAPWTAQDCTAADAVFAKCQVILARAQQHRYLDSK